MSPNGKFDMDDKDVGMIAILIICCLSMWFFKDSAIATAGITAIAALVTGRKQG